jgi:hypothetical protein
MYVSVVCLIKTAVDMYVSVSSNSYSTENTPLTNALSQTSNSNRNTLLINLIEHINNKISICMSRNRIATKYGGLNELKKARCIRGVWGLSEECFRFIGI